MVTIRKVEEERKRLLENCKGRKVIGVKTIADAMIFDGLEPHPYKRYERAILRRKLLDVERWHTYLILIFEDDYNIIVNFGPDGRFEYQFDYGELSLWPPRNWRTHIKFDGGDNDDKSLEIALVESNRWARVYTRKGNPYNHWPIGEKDGPQLATDIVKKEKFGGYMQRKDISVRKILGGYTDIKLQPWVADEILYQARVCPSDHGPMFNTEEVDFIYEKYGEVERVARQVNYDKSKCPQEFMAYQSTLHFEHSNFHMMNMHKVKHQLFGKQLCAFVSRLQPSRKDSELKDDIAELAKQLYEKKMNQAPKGMIKKRAIPKLSRKNLEELKVLQQKKRFKAENGESVAVEQEDSSSSSDE